MAPKFKNELLNKKFKITKENLDDKILTLLRRKSLSLDTLSILLNYNKHRVYQRLIMLKKHGLVASYSRISKYWKLANCRKILVSPLRLGRKHTNIKNSHFNGDENGA
ncbi:MAG: hypothetical protein QXS37_05235 [Candidatus Aenigmatarchaeota archaeon]